MDIVLIRHAERQQDVPEREAKLTPAGKQTATDTARLLQRLEADAPELGKSRCRLEKFTAILTSEYAAPCETASLLERSSSGQIYPLRCLTPSDHAGNELTPARLFLEANDASKATGEPTATLAIIGHEPVISRLLRKMTGKDSRSLDRGEAVWITGQTQDDFTSGKAALLYASRHSDYADNLRDKIQTKMTVCTFLAGFTIAALIEIIKDPDKIIRTSRVVAAISFTFALGLFVAAVYIYDELSMPRMFWHAGIAGGEASPRKHFGHDLRLNGALYAHMVRAWSKFFTPAVGFSLTGFLALLLFNLRYPHLVMDERIAIWLLIAGCVLGVLFAVLMYRIYRPRLAID